MSKAFIIISGYNTRALTAFCRKLSALKIPYYIIASGKNDFIFHTAYKKRVVAIRQNAQLLIDDFKEAVGQIQRQSAEKQLVLCPSSEYLNYFALRHRRELEDLHVELPLVEQEKYEMITNKAAFSSFCRQHGMEVPQRLKIPQASDVPFVAKPKENVRHGRTLYPYLIFSGEQYRSFKERENVRDYYFEEYIGGAESYYLLFYVSPYGGAISFSQKNLLQQAGGKSIVAALPADLHLTDIGQNYLHLLRQAGFWGLIMIELKKKGQRFIMIEANPRLWGPSQLFVDNGAPLFDAFIYENIYDQKYANAKKNGRKGRRPYLWLGGIVQNKLSGRPLAHHASGGSLSVVMRGLLNDVYLRRDTLPYFFREVLGRRAV